MEPVLNKNQFLIPKIHNKFLQNVSPKSVWG